MSQTSEIGKLNTVLLHRPGAEISHIIPEYLEQMLAEDTPHLPTAREEHDAFARLLCDNGANVLYISDLFSSVIADSAVREAFVDEYIRAACMKGDTLRALVRERLLSVSPEDFFETVAKGVMRRDLDSRDGIPLALCVNDRYPFVIDPIPNLYFTRDIGVCIGRGMVISSMSKKSRKPETLILKYIYNHYPLFASEDIPLWHDVAESCEMEGGDILVLSDSVLAIGCGERTSVAAVETLALRLFDNGYKRILLFNNPKERKSMHLDVLCTMVDRDKFLVDGSIAQKTVEVYEITPARRGIGVSLTADPVDKIFAHALSLPAVKFINASGSDPVAAAREQWNMGCNSLAVAPGRIVTYARNDLTNELLEKNGITVLRIAGSELSRGRGGPRCMSMPLNRDNI